MSDSIKEMLKQEQEDLWQKQLEEISKRNLEQPEILHIKPVKTNKTRLQTMPSNRNLVETHIVETQADGTQFIRIKRVFPEPKPMKVCEICGNQYKYQHALDSHMRRHRNEKPFECE